MNINNWDFSRLKKETDKGRALICYGAGMVAHHIGSLMEKYGLLSRVLFWTDKEEDKIGTTIKVEGKTFEIKPPDVLEDDRYRDAILFITFECATDSVSEILKGRPVVLQDCCSCLYAVNEQIFRTIRREPGGLIEKKDRTGENFRIPARIHYCWFGKKKIPDRQLRMIENWRRLCPEYEVLLWDESNYNLTDCKYVKEAYERGYYAFVTDYVRMDVVYRLGGVYFDTDVALLKNIDFLRQNTVFFTYGKWPAINSGSGFGAVRGHPLIREIRDEPRGRIPFWNDGKCNLTTNCFYETEIIRKYGFRMDFTSQNMGGIQVYSPRYFPTDTYLKEYKMPLEDVIALHCDAGSWRGIL